MKIERFLLSSTLKTVVAQRLARRLCENCKQETALTEEVIQGMVAELKDAPISVIESELPDLKNIEKPLDSHKAYKAVGCPRCEMTGYSSRVAIAEVIEINDKLRQIIDEGKANIDVSTVRQTEDFLSIKQDGIIKVLQGKTTMEEVLRVIES